MGQAPGAEVARLAATRRRPSTHELPRPEPGAEVARLAATRAPSRSIRRTSPSGKRQNARPRVSCGAVDDAELKGAVPQRSSPARCRLTTRPRSHNTPHRRCPSRASGRRRSSLTAERATSDGPRGGPSARATRTRQLRTETDSPIRREPPVPPPATPSAPAPAPEVAQHAAPAPEVAQHAHPRRSRRTSGRRGTIRAAEHATSGRPNERHAAVHDRQLIDRDRAARVAAGLAASASRPTSRNTPQPLRQCRTNCRRTADQAAVRATSAQTAAGGPRSRNTPHATMPRSHEPSPQRGPGGSPCDLGAGHRSRRCHGTHARQRRRTRRSTKAERGTRNEERAEKSSRNGSGA